MKTNERGARLGWAAGCVAWALALPAMGQTIVVDLENIPIVLSSNQSGQTFPLMANNPGPAFQVLGASLSFQIADGQSTQGVPSLTGVDVFTGTPFGLLAAGDRVANISQVTTQFTSVDYGVDLGVAPGATVTIPNGTFLLATLTFDTTSVAPGTWDFNMVGVDGDLGLDSYFTLVGFTEYAPQVSSGVATLAVVPEWGGAQAATGLLLAGWMLGRRRRQAHK